MKTKKVPMRMCLGCQQMKPKKELIRIVRRAKDSGVQVDLTGKVAGRGCYICRNVDCFEKAVKLKRIEKALEIPISEEIYQQLKREVQDEE
ncbi:putative nucleic-acid-binding protein implicated in transcription termination [Thermoanaerobacter kivui]|uniref:Putative nucleic-acid-binding protein implicated in transcription termination n=1 Tax=Thermoanaerobacter kivui TaxID=2325 RepID=A0A097ARP9_THEKI|nr:YlxR family protein [Thermoanaerobacter kivui]AIS52483.1 putative nucleic-acid-binding protein implicated in transcription termination [Thermoanaerobacter kivui]